jgi:aminoglycoside phosphotransferase (APT) family kinase protein
MPATANRAISTAAPARQKGRERQRLESRADTPETVQARLAALAPGLFGAGATLHALHRLSGGASQELWSFDIIAAGASHGLILRRNPAGTAARAQSATMAQEAQIIGLAAALGAPVPRVVHILQPGDRLGMGYIMQRVDGETLAPRILRDAAYAQARSRLAHQLGAAARLIHTVAAPDLRHVQAAQSLAETEALYRAQGGGRPVVEWALRWLHQNLPSNEAKPALVHGDYRNGNIVVGPEGLRAVLDWEGVHVGDPMEDLGWVCVTSWRFGNIAKPVGGFGAREDLFAGYQSAGGAVDPSRVRFWEVLGVLRWGRLCTMMEQESRDGEISVEKSAIGRRASETDIDLLAMLAPRLGYLHA